MKSIKLIAFALLLNLASQAQVTDTLVMVWNDEFNGSTLDDSKWGHCPNWFRQGKSYWHDDNAWVDGNGNLKLKVSEENGTVYAGAVRTHNKYNQKYGYFEVRCRVPQIKGGWAAFWMMPYGNHVGSEGNDGTELDIFESINGWNGKIQHALHWDGYGDDHQKASQSMTNWELYDGEFHKFGMIWTPDEYIFYIDDVETWRSSAGGVSDVEQYMKLTMEVSSGTWPGDWNQQTTKPITWAIDYVRTYAYGIKKPVIEFTKPNANATLTTDESQAIKAVVDGSFDYLDKVEFYVQKDGGSEELIQVRNINETNNEIFNATWIPEIAGDHSIIVKGFKDSEVLTSDTIQVTVMKNITTGINELSNDITIYPNPGSNIITLTKVVETIDIFNALGEQVLKASNTSTVDISSLSSGSYFVILDDKTMKKLVVNPLR